MAKSLLNNDATSIQHDVTCFSLQNGLTVWDVASANGHQDICRELEKSLQSVIPLSLSEVRLKASPKCQFHIIFRFIIFLH